MAKSAIILDSLQSRRWPSVHLHHSENRTSRSPRLLSVRPGRQMSVGNAALLYLTQLGSASCFLKKTIKLVRSVSFQPVCAVIPSVVATTEWMPTLSRPMVWHGPFTYVLESKCQAGLLCVCAKEPFPSAHSECQAFKPTLPCDSCSRAEHLSREPMSSRLTLFTYLRVTCRRFFTRCAYQGGCNHTLE